MATEAAAPQVNAAFRAVVEGIEDELELRQRLIVAFKQGEVALEQEIARQEALNVAKKADLITTFAQEKTLAELILQRTKAKAQYDELIASQKVATREQKRAREEEEKRRKSVLELVEVSKRSVLQNGRLLDALRISRKEYERVELAIERENAVRELGNDAKLDEIELIEVLSQSNQDLEADLKRLEGVYTRQEEAIEEIRGTIRDFSADAITDFGNIGDHFRDLTNRLYKLWFDNVVDRIFAKAGFDALIGQFASVLVGGLGGGAEFGTKDAGGNTVFLRPGSRQHGGPVMPGNLYRVNEGGRSETFLTPQGRGYILPAQDTQDLIRDATRGSGGVNVVQYITLNTQVTGDEDLNRKLGRTVDIAKREAQAMVFNSIKSGGRARSIVGAA